MSKNLKIVYITSELAPFSKSGGLADVASSLPRQLVREGCDVDIITPFHRDCLLVPHVRFQKIREHIPISLSEGTCIECSFLKTEIKEGKKRGKLTIYFIDNYRLFRSRKWLYSYDDDACRYFFFSMAALRLIKELNLNPDIIHCNDWETGIIPYLLKRKIKLGYPTLFTLHNLAYQGQGILNERKTPRSLRDDGGSKLPKFCHKEKFRLINFTKRAILHADTINTVSERYAKEIVTPDFGEGLERYLKSRKKDLFGIVNGIDNSVYNPKFDDRIYVNFDESSLNKKVKNKLKLQRELGLKIDANIPLIGLTNRLSEQKGFDLLIKIIDKLMKKSLQIVIAGSGEKSYISFFEKKAGKYSRKLSFITPFLSEIEPKVDSASDLYLLPSRFEPCGISPLISLRYGAIPIVRKVGGLSDTIKEFDPKEKTGNGFTFKKYDSLQLLSAIERALTFYKDKKLWQSLVRRAMQQSFSWEIPARKYVMLYKKVIRQAKARGNQESRIRNYELRLGIRRLGS
ncbi:starch synthase [bacterium (Candidatus Torokbacteria) CG_4_10_14_0_2_um_filter_35_8]|nr:MAG: starch synthase [bacterium (Candidatus Torokbacteria) CG_4_10_14_0_2_um_filter_35_8]